MEMNKFTAETGYIKTFLKFFSFMFTFAFLVIFFMFGVSETFLKTHLKLAILGGIILGTVFGVHNAINEVYGEKYVSFDGDAEVPDDLFIDKLMFKKGFVKVNSEEKSNFYKPTFSAGLLTGHILIYEEDNQLVLAGPKWYVNHIGDELENS